MIKKNRLIIPALIVLGIILICALFSPLIISHDPSEVNLLYRLQKPGNEFVWGTDHLGRDLFSRVITGARYSMGTTLLTLITMMLIGLFVGSISAIIGGKLDYTLMRICDVFMTIPTVVLALFMIAVLGTGLVNVVIAIALTHWAWYARIVRGMVLSLKVSPHVLSARVCGLNKFHSFIKHILPSVMVQIAVLATLDVGHVMLHVSGLSFLGLGVQSPTPEWGVMINDARQYIFTQSHLIIIPGLGILLSVMALNILGDYLRDRLDPAMEE